MPRKLARTALLVQLFLLLSLPAFLAAQNSSDAYQPAVSKPAGTSISARSTANSASFSASEKSSSTRASQAASRFTTAPLAAAPENMPVHVRHGISPDYVNNEDVWNGYIDACRAAPYAGAQENSAERVQPAPGVEELPSERIEGMPRIGED